MTVIRGPFPSKLIGHFMLEPNPDRSEGREGPDGEWIPSTPGWISRYGSDWREGFIPSDRFGESFAPSIVIFVEDEAKITGLYHALEGGVEYTEDGYDEDPLSLGRARRTLRFEPCDCPPGTWKVIPDVGRPYEARPGQVTWDDYEQGVRADLEKRDPSPPRRP